MTLDDARDYFEEFPTPSSAMDYLEAGLQYWDDSIILDNTFSNIVAKYLDYMKGGFN